jgi:hypothetical protein
MWATSAIMSLPLRLAPLDPAHIPPEWVAHIPAELVAHITGIRTTARFRVAITSDHMNYVRTAYNESHRRRS